MSGPGILNRMERGIYSSHTSQKGGHATGCSRDNCNCISSAELDIICHVQLQLIEGDACGCKSGEKADECFI